MSKVMNHAVLVAVALLSVSLSSIAQDMRYATAADKRAVCQAFFHVATEAKAMLTPKSTQDDALRVAQIVVNDYRAGKLGFGFGTDAKALDNVHSVSLNAWTNLINPPTNPLQDFSSPEFLSDCLRSAQ